MNSDVKNDRSDKCWEKCKTVEDGMDFVYQCTGKPTMYFVLDDVNTIDLCTGHSLILKPFAKDGDKEKREKNGEKYASKKLGVTEIDNK